MEGERARCGTGWAECYHLGKEWRREHMFVRICRTELRKGTRETALAASTQQERQAGRGQGDRERRRSSIVVTFVPFRVWTHEGIWAHELISSVIRFQNYLSLLLSFLLPWELRRTLPDLPPSRKTLSIVRLGLGDAESGDREGVATSSIEEEAGGELRLFERDWYEMNWDFEESRWERSKDF